MAIVNLPSAAGAASITEVIDVVERLRKEVQFLLNNIESDNITSVEYKTVQNVLVDTAQLKDAVITSAKIGVAEILEANIRDAQISSAKIADAAITNAKIDNLAVGTANIQDAAITTAKIKDAEITNAKIANAAIDSAKIKDAAITTAKIETGAITTALIKDAAIGTTQIADGSITDAKIVDLTANKITAGTLDASKVSVTNLVADNIVTGTLTIATANLVVNGELQDISALNNPNGAYIQTAVDGVVGNVLNISRSVNSSAYVSLKRFTLNAGKTITVQLLYRRDQYVNDFGDIAYLRTSATLDGSDTTYGYDTTYTFNKSTDFKKNVGSYVLITKTIALPNSVKSAFFQLRHCGSTNGVNAAVATFGKVMVSYGSLAPEWQPHTNELLASKGITNLQIGDSAVDNRVITANTITGDKLVAEAITAREIKSKSITANEIVSGTITAASGILADLSVTTAKIADIAITTAKIADASITNAKIKDLSADKITAGTIKATNGVTTLNLDDGSFRMGGSQFFRIGTSDTAYGIRYNYDGNGKLEINGDITSGSTSALRNYFSIADGVLTTSYKNINSVTFTSTMASGDFRQTRVSSTEKQEVILSAWDGVNITRYTTPTSGIIDKNVTLKPSFLNIYGRNTASDLAFDGTIWFQVGDRRQSGTTGPWVGKLSFDTLDIDMSNNNINNVNHLTFNDIGGREGIEWLSPSGLNNWRIVVTNDAGTGNDDNVSYALQFFRNDERMMSLGTTGNLYITGTAYIGHGSYTSFEATNGYVVLRAKDGLAGSNVYLQSDQEVRAVKVNSTTSYTTFRAGNIYQNGTQVTSSGSLKTNIKMFDELYDSEGLLDEVNIYAYNYQHDVDDLNFYNKQVGMIAEGIPQIFKGGDSDSISLNSTVFILVDAFKKLKARVMKLENRQTDLEMVV